ncbi:C-type lectin domain family 4 member E [Procambarus clarkii]|uniref:C-type lectin domain family 4 member E n=1 Tax=Procambarus clarkii TaxID=6728 RepID=UPI0037428078
MFVLALLVIGLLTQGETGAAGAASCPEPFVTIGEGCYFFSYSFVTWQEARTTCQSLLPGEDADLAVLDSTCDDFRHIASYAITNELTPFWVGASDDLIEGYWTWVDGRPVDMTASYWNTEEPLDGNSYNCAYLAFHSEKTFRLRLNADYCFDIWPCLCQLGVHSLK